MVHEYPRDPVPEKPSVEPEVLPPEDSTSQWRGRGPGVFVFMDRFGQTRRVSFTPPGPLAIILALLAAGAIAALVLVVLLGLVLLWIPISLTVVGAVLAAGFWRRFKGGRLRR
jgi:hypothetical protein